LRDLDMSEPPLCRRFDAPSPPRAPPFMPAGAVAARGSERPRAGLGIHALPAREVQSILRRGGKI
jgi:hypothetical protein